MEPPQQQPSLGAWAVLALLREGDTHGWALVRALAPEGEIGRVWSIRRALVYRTVELLIEADLVERAGLEPGTRGSPRTRLRLTAAGRRAVEQWLGEPVGHVRDLRSALLLKLLFAQRASLDREPLLQAQRAILAETVAALETEIAADGPAEATVRAFRLETARAGVRFVDGELARLAESV
jgi:DNA-binding PadR family transcriptional regulator